MTSRRLIPRLTSEQKAELLGDSHARETERKRASRTMERRTETAAFRWLTLQAFLTRPGVRILQTESTNYVSFPTMTEAEQLHKLLLNARGRR